jgi:hypothetical protein
VCCGADVGVTIDGGSVWSISQLLISTDKGWQDGKENTKRHSHKRRCSEWLRVEAWLAAKGEFVVDDGKAMSITWQGDVEGAAVDCMANL